MKSRLLAIFTILSLVLIPAPSHASSPLTLGLAYDIGGLGDRSFNDAAAVGLEKAKKQFDFTLNVVVTNGSSADREKRLRSLISKNCNPVIAIGSGYAPTIQALAIEFPSTQFAILNDASVAALNVTSLIFADTQGAYLAGFSAAQISKSGKVAMIATSNQADTYANGFSAGVIAAKKKVVPIVKYVSGSTSIAAKQVIDAGADIVYVAVTGSDTDIFNAIVASNTSKNRKKNAPIVKMISIEPDQYVTVTSRTKKYLVATVEKRVDKMLFDIIGKSVDHGQFLDFIDANVGIYGKRYGITGGGIEFNILTDDLVPFKSAINSAAAIAEKIPA